MALKCIIAHIKTAGVTNISTCSVRTLPKKLVLKREIKKARAIMMSPTYKIWLDFLTSIPLNEVSITTAYPTILI
jgi:hypothetical protein